MTEQEIRDGKTAAIVGYLTIVGTLIAIFMNLEPKNRYARFHIRQAFGLNVSFFALGFMVSFFDSWPISLSFYAFIIVLWSFGFVNAIQGTSRPIPILGPYFQEWFTFIE